MSEDKQSKAILSRRDMLKIIALAGGTAFTSGIGITNAAALGNSSGSRLRRDDAVTITTMLGNGFFTDQNVTDFQAKNPSIKINNIDFDQTRYFAMAAAGNAPDLVRVQATGVPGLVGRGLMKNVTPYYQASSVVKIDDLAPVNDFYRADGPFKIGTGNYYGTVVNWSPDMTLFINVQAFQDAGVTVPDDTKPITYQELADIAQKLTKRTGDRLIRAGLFEELNWVDRFWMVMLAEKRQSLFSADQKKVVIRDNPDAVAAVKWFFDLAKAGVMNSSLNPISGAWLGETFPKDQQAITQYGYWFTPWAIGDQNKDSVKMLPAPTWAGVPIDPTVSATGAFITATSKMPDQAYKFYEWIFFDTPSADRTKLGQGVPALKSMYSLLPANTPYQKQVKTVLDGELKKTYTVKFNPYFLQYEPTPIAASFIKHLEAAVSGSLTFDKFLEAIETDSNLALKNGVDSLPANL